MGDKISKRCCRIMEMLLDSPAGLRGEDIARRLEVSSRTVRSDIRKLQEALSSYRSEIVAIPNRGYRLENRDGHEVLMSLMAVAPAKINLDSKIERRRFLTSRFLEAVLCDRSLTQLELADEMFMSLSSLKTYLSEFRIMLSEYSLDIAQYKNEGLRLQGEEAAIRRLLVDHIREARDEKLQERIYSELSQKEINSLISQVMEECNLQLTDVARESLCLKLALSLHRSARGHFDACPASMAQKMAGSFEFSIAKELANKIFTSKGIDVAYNEVFYITQCLMTSKKLVPLMEDSQEEEPLVRLVDEILRVVRSNFGLNFLEDQYLREGLTLHLRIAIAQVNFRVGIRNVLLDSIKKDYPLAFRLGVLAAKVVWEREQVRFNESEIGYLALHFGAAMSRNNIEEKDVVKNVLIVCSAGLGVSILLNAKVKEHFRHRLHVMRVLPAYELTEEVLSQADYVLTTVPLPEWENRKIIQVNHMLRQEDIDKIEQVIFHQPVLSRELMKSFFDERAFFLDKEFRTREECLEFLTEQAISLGFMSRDSKASVFEREKLSPTSIGDMAAIPHSLDANAAVSNISVLVLKKPIPWGDLPVQIVFLLNIEHGKSALWEELFLRLYYYVKKSQGLASILKNRSFPRFLEEFAGQE